MKWTFVSRSRHDAVLADRERIRSERNQFAEDRDAALAAAKTAASKFATADAASTRLEGWNKELRRRLDDATDSQHVAQLEARVEELTALAVQANAALEEQATKLRAAEERARLAERPTVVEEQTVDGAPLVRREPSSTRLKRSEARCRALEERLGLMQDSHIADTRELHDLRQGVAS